MHTKITRREIRVGDDIRVGEEQRKGQIFYQKELYELVDLYISGMNYKELAKHFGASPNTIRRNLDNIYYYKAGLDLSNEKYDQLTKRILE